MTARIPLLLISLLSVPLMATEPITIAGSDLLQPVLTAPIEQFAKENDAVIQLTLDGTTGARKTLQDGSTMIAIIAVPDTVRIPEGFEQIPFCYQVTQIVVNTENPITEIRIEQLAGVYGVAGQKNYKQWSELGLMGPWGSKSINAYAVRNDQSLALEIFKSTVLNNIPIKTTINYREDPKALMAKIGDDISSIGLLPAMPLTGRVKVIPVSTATGKEYAPSYFPTAEAADFGDYPLTLNFVIVYGKEHLGEIKPILQFLLSDTVAEALDNAKFLSSPRKTRRENSLSVGLR